MKNNFNNINEKPGLGDVFLSSDNAQYTYGELDSFTHSFLHILTNAGIDNPKLVGLHAHSCDELILIIAACWIHRIPFVSFNPDAKASNLRQQIDHVEPTLIITDKPKQFEQVPVLPIETFRPENIQDKPGITIPSLEDATEKIFGYFFTSGTSGSPKTVPLKRRQMLAAAEASAKNLCPAPNTHWLLCLPLYHIGGISVVLRSLLYGSAIYRMDEFETDSVARLLSDQTDIAAASLVPTMLQRLLNEPSFTPQSSLLALLLGGGPISSELLHKCLEREIPVITSYGMTETCAQIAANPLSRSSQSDIKSVGQLFTGNEVTIRDKQERLLTAGQSGTIWLKGPQVFDGYLHDEGRNFDTEGWFNTGDYGRLDANANLYIESRRTDLIITGGENVSPYEVETAIKKISGIDDAAVTGIDDQQWGQKVAAVIVLNNHVTLTRKDIQIALKSEIESFKIPKEIVFTDTLPRTQTGKVNRSSLKNLF